MAPRRRVHLAVPVASGDVARVEIEAGVVRAGRLHAHGQVRVPSQHAPEPATQAESVHRDAGGYARPAGVATGPIEVRPRPAKAGAREGRHRPPASGARTDGATASARPGRRSRDTGGRRRENAGVRPSTSRSSTIQRIPVGICIHDVLERRVVRQIHTGPYPLPPKDGNWRPGFVAMSLIFHRPPSQPRAAEAIRPIAASAFSMPCRETSRCVTARICPPAPPIRTPAAPRRSTNSRLLSPRPLTSKKTMLVSGAALRTAMPSMAARPRASRRACS